MITYYDSEGNEWQVKGDPLTPDEEREIGNICAIQYSNKLNESPIKTRGVYENIVQHKYYVKMEKNRLYDPSDDRYLVSSTPPKQRDSCVTTSKKDIVEQPRNNPGGEGVAQCRSDKPQIQPTKTNKDTLKKVSQVAFEHYVCFLKGKLHKYYTAATREM